MESTVEEDREELKYIDEFFSWEEDEDEDEDEDEFCNEFEQVAREERTDQPSDYATDMRNKLTSLLTSLQTHEPRYRELAQCDIDHSSVGPIASCKVLCWNKNLCYVLYL